MSANAIFFGWNRSIPGREHISSEHFAEFVNYLTKQKTSNAITSFEPVFLRPHAGDLNGFFLIHGDTQKLHQLVETNEWVEHTTRATHHLESTGYVFADTGNEVQKRLETWTKAIPPHK
jgi:hypothetical protein